MSVVASTAASVVAPAAPSFVGLRRVKGPGALSRDVEAHPSATLAVRPLATRAPPLARFSSRDGDGRARGGGVAGRPRGRARADARDPRRRRLRRPAVARVAPRDARSTDRAIAKNIVEIVRSLSLPSFAVVTER
jgi:hypothetical protein